MEKEAKRDLGTSGPSARISLANSSQPPNPGGTAGPRTERGVLTLLYFSTSWVSFLSPNGQTRSSRLNKWQLHSFSCSGPKLGSQAISDFSRNSSANSLVSKINPEHSHHRPLIPWVNSYPLLLGLRVSFRHIALRQPWLQCTLCSPDRSQRDLLKLPHDGHGDTHSENSDICFSLVSAKRVLQCSFSERVTRGGFVVDHGRQRE